MTSRDHAGCDAEVFPDPATGKVISRFFNPATGEMVVELHLDPAVSREFAFNLTRASLALEE